MSARAILLLCLVTGTAAAHQNIPPPPQRQPLLITGATIHTVSGENIVDGQLLFADGRIVAIAAADERLEAGDAQVLSLAGKHIYPAMIAANSTLGLAEISAVRASLDLAEPGSINPNARAEIAVNPDSELIPVVRSNGVLAALAVPQASADGLITGTSALLQLEGWTWENMIVAAPVGLHVVWPLMSFHPSLFPPEQPVDIETLREQHEERLALLEDSFEAAAAYRAARRSGEPLDVDLRWEAMLGVFDGRLPVFAHAQDLAQIRSALQLAGRHGLHLVIVGGTDAWRIAAELRERDVAVILTGTHSLPRRRWEPYDSGYAAAAKLAAAGVRYCIAGQGDAFSSAMEGNLPYRAAVATGYGLSADEALRAVTLYPAQILGVGDRLGSLEPGKDATFFVSDGDPLEVTTRIERAYVQGQEIDLSSRHTRLYEKYLEKQRQVTGHQ